MALNYPIQPTAWLIGSESSSSTLTDTFADNEGEISVGGMSQIEVYITYIPAENNAILFIQEEMGPETSDIYKRVINSVNTTTNIVTVLKPPYNFVGTTAGTTYKLRLSEPIADKVYRLSFKETATLYGTLKVRTTISGL